MIGTQVDERMCDFSLKKSATEMYLMAKASYLPKRLEEGERCGINPGHCSVSF